jgi:hypothetical protein
MTRPPVPAAYASVIAGITALFAVSWHTGGRGYGWAQPILIASLVSGAAFALTGLFLRAIRRTGNV